MGPEHLYYGDFQENLNWYQIPVEYQQRERVMTWWEGEHVIMDHISNDDTLYHHQMEGEQLKLDIARQTLEV